jgi:histidyl-tRNA synthetase
MSQKIQPRLLKGFRDFLPEQELRRREILFSLEKTFKSFGFLPIDTPVLEYTEILLGKGGGDTDKQIYRFTDHGGRDVALRYDLTVPFARYMAAHANEVPRPFRRYHIGKVFRGENTQRGRYREFMQCDFDIVGSDGDSADFEILLLITRSLQTLGIEDFEVHFSHRGVFNNFLKKAGMEAQSSDILRTVDKLGKIGKEATLGLLEEICSKETAEQIMDFIEGGADNRTTLTQMTALSGGPSPESERLSRVLDAAEELGLQGAVLDPSITRGLDYYTGIVFETFLTGQPEIGSVCSGGRYNNLASLYTKEVLPGVGASVGLDRLIAALYPDDEQIEMTADILVFCLDERFTSPYHRMADYLRGAGFSVEVYPDAKKISSQFSYAEKKKIPVALICGEDEFSGNTVTFKDLRERKNYSGLTIEDAAAEIRKLLS